MLKMLLDPMGGIVLSNDGHAILREIEVIILIFITVLLFNYFLIILTFIVNL